MMEEKQASIMQDMRKMMAEFVRNNDPSESSSAEGSAAVRGNSADYSEAVRGSPRGAEPTAAEQISCCCCCWMRSARRYDSSKKDDFS